MNSSSTGNDVAEYNMPRPIGTGQPNIRATRPMPMRLPQVDCRAAITSMMAKGMPKPKENSRPPIPSAHCSSPSSPATTETSMPGTARARPVAQAPRLVACHRLPWVCRLSTMRAFISARRGW